jgi:hypothetical protein
MGNTEKAKELMDNYVLHKTYEPALLYQAAEVYKANNEAEKVKDLKKELIGAVYELGPLMERQIQEL